MEKNLPASAEDSRSCGFDPHNRKTSEKEIATDSSILALGNSGGRRSLVGFSTWDCKELDMTM